MSEPSIPWAETSTPRANHRSRERTIVPASKTIHPASEPSLPRAKPSTLRAKPSTLRAKPSILRAKPSTLPSEMATDTMASGSMATDNMATDNMAADNMATDMATDNSTDSTPGGLRITAFNVNGISNPFKHEPFKEKPTYQEMFETLGADIVVMEDLKIQRKELKDEMISVPGWDVFLTTPKHRLAYAGLAIYTRTSKCCPIRAEEGITGCLCVQGTRKKYRDLPPEQQIGGYVLQEQTTDCNNIYDLDTEGRCVVLEFPAFVLIGINCPPVSFAHEGRKKIQYNFLECVDARVRNLVAMGKQVVVAGAMNVTRSTLDTAEGAEGAEVADFLSLPSRRLFNQLLFGGVVNGDRDSGREQPVLWDLCRKFHPHRRSMFTSWSPNDGRKKPRSTEHMGRRIDYLLCTSGVRDWFIDANTQEHLRVSDYCPTYATLGSVVRVDRARVSLADRVNPPGMVMAGQRLRDWCQQNLLPLSGRLIRLIDSGGTQPSYEPWAGTIAFVVEPQNPGPPPGHTSKTNVPNPIAPAPRPIRKRQREEDVPYSRRENPKSQRLVHQTYINRYLQPKTPTEGDAEAEGASTPPVAPPRPANPSAMSHWRVVFYNDRPPKCGHGEECRKTMTQNRASGSGTLAGRPFYMCARSAGPSGKPENNTIWRCNYFKWSGEWHGYE